MKTYLLHTLSTLSSTADWTLLLPDKSQSLRAFLLLWQGLRHGRHKCTFEGKFYLSSLIPSPFYIYLVKIIPVFKNINPNPMTQYAEYLWQDKYTKKESFVWNIPCTAVGNRFFNVWLSIPVYFSSWEESIDKKWSNNDLI